MTARHDFLIVGRGMMGAAAARHLAASGANVCLIGPDEPENNRVHTGVFASHYDEGRITRRIDPDPVWARLAARSIERYRQIEAESGIDFYREIGCLVAGLADSDYVSRTCRTSADLALAVETLDSKALKAAFPYFDFPAISHGLFEAKMAGHISPRRLVAAQSLLAERAGATVIRDYVSVITDEGSGVAVTLASGQRLLADKVLVAAGAFSVSDGLLPDRLGMKVYGRTVVLFEIDEGDAAAFSGMPSLIFDGPGMDIYLLPPIRYPDGKLYLKIGGDPDDMELSNADELKAWFKTSGRQSARDHLERVARQLVPDMAPRSVSTMSCALSHTASRYPMIGYSRSPSIAVMAGCGGASAKSSDEIGRLGAELLSEGRIVDPSYRREDFAPVLI